MFFNFLSLVILSLVHGQEVAPGIEDVQFGINIFLGKTPHEQRQNLDGDQLFQLTNDDTSDDTSTYIKHDQINEINTATTCVYQEKSSKVEWGTSSSTLERQSFSSSDGYDQQVTMGMDYKGFSAETSLRNALIFGNSKTSTTEFNQQSNGFTYSVDTQSSRIQYNVEIDWDDFIDDDWTDDLKQDISNLGNNPSINDILTFWQDYGTHGLDSAGFGQTCKANLFMEYGATKSKYEEFNSGSSSSTVGLLWWTSSSQSSESDSSVSTYDNSFEYKTSNKYCYGELNYNSGCGADMQASGRTAPAIIRWTYKPIWEMNIPGFTDGAISMMEDVANDIYTYANTCRQNNCNGNGYCRPSLSFWSGSITLNSNSYSQLYDSNKCFCDDNYIGTNCENGELVELKYSTWTGYENSYDGDLDYSDSYAICGIESIHDNGREDRRFSFQPCRPDSSNYDSFTGQHQIFPTTYYDQSWTFECDGNKVLRRIKSHHDNGREDREWDFECEQLENTKIINCDWGNNYRNSWDGYFKQSCDSGKIIHGLSSYHDNGREDRLFKYQCCELQYDDSSYKTITKSGWTSYQNSWDNSHTYDISSDNRILCGVSSYHDNGREDRRYRFKYCYPSSSNPGLTDITGWSSETNWDANWSYSCSDSRAFLVGWSSYHDNGREDRRFKFKCGEYNGATSGDCTWTDYLNNWDDSIDFECGTGYGLKGVSSYHDNGREDRRWKYQCCRIQIPN